ncbi:MAG: MBL fold metallo-hydrolase [Eubacteriales bacterium]|nr:MBL fold metallo-hydrolase [Eubacteriales bacterium]
MTFYPLASSSKGNAYLVSDGDSSILMECGLTHKELRKRAPVPLSSLAAVFVTHEHGDHAKCAGQLIRAGLPVYMSEGTARALELENALVLEPGETVHITEHLRIMAFEVFHDAAQPLGYLLQDIRTGEKLLFAIDTVNLNYIVPGLTHIAIECNYADDLLGKLTRLPDKTKYRIRRTHMEVETAIKYIKKLDLRKMQTIYLMHMSAASGDAGRFCAQFRRHFPGVEIVVCRE